MQTPPRGVSQFAATSPEPYRDLRKVGIPNGSRMLSTEVYKYNRQDKTLLCVVRFPVTWRRFDPSQPRLQVGKGIESAHGVGIA